MESPGGSGSLEGVHCNGHASGHSMLGNGYSRIAEQAAPVNEGTHSSSREAQIADTAASGPPDQAARQADTSVLQQTCFSEELVGIRVCFQLVDLGRQLYVWAGLENGAQGCMCLASPPTGDCPFVFSKLSFMTPPRAKGAQYMSEALQLIYILTSHQHLFL